jgi:hypothetical protein
MFKIFVSDFVYEVKTLFIGIFISAKQCMMLNCICIPYLFILQIIKFIATHTTQ